LKAAGAFSQCGVFWLEEPLFAEDIEGHAQLRENGKVPIAVGENLSTHYWNSTTPTIHFEQNC
jgi:L-alanine-DL-glutamate epimerase-like enolase superfamily enzyme